MSYRALLFAVLCAACAGRVPEHARRAGAPAAHDPTAPVSARDDVGEGIAPPPAPIVDEDGDGLDDALEDRVAHDYLPFLSTHPDDRCPLSGLVYRARPHPSDPRLIAIVYSRLYQADCGVDGIGAHPGDNEAFGVTVDPGVPAPGGLVAIVAVSHQGTLCERDTVCGVCDGLDACDVSAGGVPVVYASKDKHASVVQLGSGCNPFGTCLDRCELAAEAPVLPMVNAGEPAHPFVDDLTDGGFITAANGWTDASLYHYDPWGPDEFGTAGVVSGDMIDDAFVAPACTAPGSPTGVEEAFVRAPTNERDGRLCEAPADAADVVDPVNLACDVEVNNDIAPPDQSADALHVVEWNIRIGHDHAAILDHLEHDPALAAADVLLLAEVARDDGESVPAGLFEARDLAALLGMNYAYAVEWDHRFVDGAPEPKGEHGEAVLSRFPIGNIAMIRHTPAHDFWGDTQLLGGRVTLGATLLVGDKQVRVYASHLCTRPTPLPDDGPRAVQGAEIRADADRAGRPLVQIVAGDFNTWTCNPALGDCTRAPKAERVVQDFAAAGFSDGTAGFTGVTSGPQRLDWIFYRGATGTPGTVVDVDGSDHKPLVFDVALR